MDATEVLANAGVEIVDCDEDTICAHIETSLGTVTVIADLVRVGDLLLIDRAHVEGQGLSLTLIHHLARVFGEVEDVKEVIVQRGRRTSGSRKGTVPSPIKVRL